MKNYQKGIILLTICSLVGVGGYFLGKTSIKKAKENEITVLAEDSDPVVGDGIVNHTLALSDTIYLGYYVHDSISLNDGEEIKVYVWNNEIDAKNTLEPDYICDFYQNVTSESGTTYGLYLLKGLGYKNLVDVMYAREVVTSQGRVIRGAEDVDDYSMLDYCFNHKNDSSCVNGSSYSLGSLINEMVNYATSCQKYFNYRTDHLAVDYFWYPRKALAYTNLGNYFYTSIDFLAWASSKNVYKNEIYVTFLKPFETDEIFNFTNKGGTTYIKFYEGTKFLSKANFLPNENTLIGDLDIENATFSSDVSIEFPVSFNNSTFLNSVTIDNEKAGYTMPFARFINCTFVSCDSEKTTIDANNMNELLFNQCNFESNSGFSRFSLNVTNCANVYFRNCKYPMSFAPKFSINGDAVYAEMNIKVAKADYDDSNSKFSKLTLPQKISLTVVN